MYMHEKIFHFQKGIKNYHPLIALINADFPAPLSPVTPNRIFTSLRPPSFSLRNFSMSWSTFFLLYAPASTGYSSVTPEKKIFDCC